MAGKTKGAFIALVFLLIGAGCFSKQVTPPIAEETEGYAQTPIQPVTEEPMTTEPTSPTEEMARKQIRIETEKGEIVFELFEDTAPKATSNFIKLANEKYFDGLRFHRRVEGFVIQGGDPYTRDESKRPLWGTGGPGYEFEDELTDSYAYNKGIVAMANHGPNTNGSQFFIMLKDYPLPKAYTIFGRVVEGIEVVDALAQDDVMKAVSVVVPPEEAK